MNDSDKPNTSLPPTPPKILQNLRWLRLVGDTIFLSGVASLAWFVLGLRTGWSFQPGRGAPARAPEGAALARVGS